MSNHSVVVIISGAVVNCIFINHNPTGGSIINVNDVEGLDFDGDCNVTDCTFVNNTCGIVYGTVSKGQVNHITFIGNNADCLLNIKGNVSVFNSTFSDNIVEGHVLFFDSGACGSVYNNMFTRNNLRNVNITDLDGVSVYNNIFDSNMTWFNVPVSVYGKDCLLNVTLDAGGNFVLNNVSLYFADNPDYIFNLNTTDYGLIGVISGGVLDAGEYSVYFAMDANDNRFFINGGLVFTVNQTVSDIIIYQDPLDPFSLVVNFTHGVKANATGNVTVFINGKSYDGIIDDEGCVRLPGNLSYLNNNVAVVYYGSKNFKSTYNSTSIYVDKINASLNVTGLGDVEIENDVMFTVWTNNTEINSSDIVVLLNGVKIVNITKLSAGVFNVSVPASSLRSDNYTVSVSLAETSSYYSIDGNMSFAVLKHKV